MKGGSKVVVEKHRHEGVFVARGKEDALVTRNMVVGESVYGEKRISVDEALGQVVVRCDQTFWAQDFATVKLHATNNVCECVW